MPLQFENNSFALITATWVMGSIVAISAISKWGKNYTKRFSKQFVNKISALAKNAKFYYESAQQDTKPLLQLIHANFAVAYAQTARLLATDDEINAIARINMQELVFAAQKAQRKAISACKHACPKLDAPPNNVGAFVDL